VQRWAAAGKRFTLVTVARTWGSAPRPPGAWMAIRDDGLVQGSVSGGCIETDLIDRLLAGEFADSPPAVLGYGVTADEARRFGLPCGGRMELVIETTPELSPLQQMAELIAAGQPGCRITAGAAGDSLEWDGRTLTTLHGPAWRLLIVGAGQISSFLAQMAQALDYQVYICDPRSEYAAEWNVAGTTLLPGMPDDIVLELGLDPHSAVIALTHDPKLDDLVLLEALKSPAFYVGALGSRGNTAKRKERLALFDLSAAEIERLHGPIGLDIGSRTPAEIAVSILAEIVAVKNGIALTQKKPVAAAASH